MSVIRRSRLVIFLDIDGVLQPSRNQNRFKHDMEALKEELAKKYHFDYFLFAARSYCAIIRLEVRAMNKKRFVIPDSITAEEMIDFYTLKAYS